MTPYSDGVKTILLTGFEPFGGDDVNPSHLAALALDGAALPGARVVSAVLPVDTVRVAGALHAALERARPDAVLLTGLAAGRPWPSVERVAVNVLDFRAPDNAGQVRSGEPVVPGGPDAYLSGLPLAGILAAWRAAGVPGYVSDTAGLYLCNQSMYLARHVLGAGVPCGFLHLPANEAVALNARAPLPYLPQAEIERGVRVALGAIAAALNATAGAAAD